MRTMKGKRTGTLVILFRMPAEGFKGLDTRHREGYGRGHAPSISDPYKDSVVVDGEATVCIYQTG
jgi:hypothetical protein